MKLDCHQKTVRAKMNKWKLEAVTPALDFGKLICK